MSEGVPIDQLLGGVKLDSSLGAVFIGTVIAGVCVLVRPIVDLLADSRQRDLADFGASHVHKFSITLRPARRTSFGSNVQSFSLGCSTQSTKLLSMFNASAPWLNMYARVC
jgi:hypothetical protein